jgi:hypothetical protein
MSDDDEDSGGQVIAFRGSDGQPVVVPSEIAAVADLPYRCYLHKRAGMSWQNIAELENICGPITGKPSGQQAQKTVERYLDEGAALITDWSRKALMNMQMDRYECIIAAHWAAMQKGSIASAGIVMNAMREQNHLTRIDQPVLGNEDAMTNSKTVVINDAGEGYSAALQKAAGKG